MYRDSMQAARDRQEALRSELRVVQDKIESLKTLGERADQIETELKASSRDLESVRARTPLPLLGQVRVAKPCKEKWENMRGDDRVRFCGRCDKNVYDLSELTTAQAEGLLAEHEMNLCVRYYRRADGTVMTSDCPEGQRRRRIQWAAAAVVTAGLAGSSLGIHFGGEEEGPIAGGLMGQQMMGEPTMDEPVAGGISPDPVPPPEICRAALPRSQDSQE